jgi:hypothetical protein
VELSLAVVWKEQPLFEVEPGLGQKIRTISPPPPVTGQWPQELVFPCEYLMKDHYWQEWEGLYHHATEGGSAANATVLAYHHVPDRSSGLPVSYTQSNLDRSDSEGVRAGRDNADSPVYT